MSALLSGRYAARITTEGSSDVFTACVTFSDEVKADEASADIVFDDGRPGTLNGNFTLTSVLEFNYQHAADSGEGEMVVRFGRERADGDWRSTVNGKTGSWTLTKTARRP